MTARVNWLMTLAVAALLGVAHGAPAFSAGDAEEGRKLAVQWCSSCHDIEPGGATSDMAPSLASVIAERGRSTEWIRTWLTAPHEPMPDLSLSRQEIDDLVAYIEQLNAEN